MRRATRRYALEKVIALPREQLWDILGNTDHLNRDLGLAPIEFTPVAADGTGLAREVRMRYLGFNLRWREYPFQWVKGERHAVLREYHEGPLKSFVGGLELADAPAMDGAPATLLRAFADMTPASAIGEVVVPFVAKRTLRKTIEYCDHYVQMWREGQNAAVFEAGSQPQVNRQQLETLLTALKRRPVDRVLVPRLSQFLAEARDDEVAGLRPYRLAALWGAEPDEALRLCLYATKVGLLNLRWEVMCPNCRVSKVETSSLSQIENQFHCDLCGVNYSPNFDRYIELRFAVHPTVREAAATTYCLGSPTRSPHILVQQHLPSEREEPVLVPHSPDELRIRVLRTNQTVDLIPSSDPETPTPGVLVYRADGWDHSGVPAPPGGSTINVLNQTTDEIVLVVEKMRWDEDAATAAKVTTMQEFRDLFSSEVLAPGNNVSVENLTLFFSDLRDSTVLYETVGDAPAYSRVRDHFDFMGRIIAANSGGVVKTIGDAVMAAFYSPQGAVRAALQIQQEVQTFNAGLPAGDSIIIKIGLHCGPAIAINSNDRLDYFGRTVNIAARIEGASGGDDVVMSGDCFHCSGVRDVLREYGVKVDKFMTNLKGIEGVFELYRVRL